MSENENNSLTCDSIIELYNKHNNFGKYINIDFKIIEKGIVEYNGVITENILATPVAAHGGFVASLCDGALGIAALSIVAENKLLVSTVEMNIKYLKPILLNDKIKGKGKVISFGKKLFFQYAKFLIKIILWLHTQLVLLILILLKNQNINFYI